VLAQKKKDKNKVYSLHEVDVQCISKGKEHKLYEFGNKVSITRTGTGVIVGALSFRKEFDRHTLDKAIEPEIGHLKEDNYLFHNYYKGIIVDEINVMLAVAGFNFKRIMDKWKSSFWLFFEKIFLFLNRQLDPIRGGVIL